MSLRARIRRLERDVEWLRWWGRLRAVEKRMKIIEIQKAMAKAQAAKPILLGVSSAGARKRLDAPRAPLDEEVRVKPPPPPLPHAEERLQKPRLEGCEPAPPPDPAIHPSDPPEHMQIRPVQWRKHGQADPYEDAEPGTHGQCVVDYDPLAGGDDDDR